MMEFRGKLNDLSFDREGNCRITLTSFSDFRDAYDELANKDIVVNIKPYNRKRSLHANSYCWALIDQIAELSGISKEDIYRKEVRNIGGVSKQVWCEECDVQDIIRFWEKKGLGWQAEETDRDSIGNVCLTLYAGSSCYNTRQMSMLIDNIVTDAKDLGIETLTPKELEKMLGKWDKYVQEHNAE